MDQNRESNGNLICHNQSLPPDGTALSLVQRCFTFQHMLQVEDTATVGFAFSNNRIRIESS
jgi:hypothetical protein